jgi:hypothetical protein
MVLRAQREQEVDAGNGRGVRVVRGSAHAWSNGDF